MTPSQEVVFLYISALVPSVSPKDSRGKVWARYCIIKTHPDGYMSSPRVGSSPTKSCWSECSYWELPMPVKPFSSRPLMSVKDKDVEAMLTALAAIPTPTGGPALFAVEQMLLLGGLQVMSWQEVTLTTGLGISAAIASPSLRPTMMKSLLCLILREDVGIDLKF